MAGRVTESGLGGGRRGFGGAGVGGGGASSDCESASYPENTNGAHRNKSGEISRTLHAANRAAKQAWVTDGIKHTHNYAWATVCTQLQHRLLVPKLLEIHRFKHCTNPPGDVSVQRREMMGTSLNRWTSTQYAMCSLIQIDQHITRVP